MHKSVRYCSNQSLVTAFLGISKEDRDLRATKSQYYGATSQQVGIRYHDCVVVLMHVEQAVSGAILHPHHRLTCQGRPGAHSLVVCCCSFNDNRTLLS
jgi:hypothetical protein